MEKIKKIFLYLSICLFLVVPYLASAQPDLGIEYANNFGLAAASEDDPKNMAVSLVKYLMTFLGIVAVVIILYGGFMWMTAAGNEDRVDKAKKIIIAGAIGLVIILAAFAIVTFVINIGSQAINGDIAA